MRYYPIFLRVAGRRCVVIGGGRIAQQKVESLLAAEARIDVISPTLTPDLGDLAARGIVKHHRRAYVTGDLRGYCLIFAATDNAEVQRQVAAEASQLGIPLNVVDRPGLCDFIVPSIVERGDLLIATSTSGASPALASRIRTRLQSEFGPEYAPFLHILRRLREHAVMAALPTDERQRIFGRLVDSPLVELVRDGRSDAIDELLQDSLGPTVSLHSLGVALP